MIKVRVHTKQGNITDFHIQGHSGSADRGEDLVCAGVSSIGVGILNALDELCKGECSLQMKEADIRITTSSNNEDVQIILKTLFIQMQTMEERYKKYINIVKEEV